MTDITWRNEQRKLSDLIPWEHNPKQLTTKQGEHLTISLDKFGQVLPFAVSPDGEIYDGHQRQFLMQRMSEYGPDAVVDVRVASRPLTDDERRELVVRLRENQADWDFDLLGNLYDVEELTEWGFPEWRLAELTPDEETTEGDTEPHIDRAEELREKWQVETGQLWRLGAHRLICGDCTDAAVVERVMGGEKADAVITDPPYGQNQAGVTNDEPEKLQQIIDGCTRNLPIINAVVIAFSSPRTFPTWLDAARSNGHKFERMLWLYKAAQETFPWRGWLLTSEAILATTVGTGHWQDVHPYSHDCYYKSEVSGELAPGSGWHGSVKPLDVVQDLMVRVSPLAAIVYDPFLGSGTTIIACENLGRRCRAVEISPGYVGVALERFFQHTGVQPVLLESAL